MTRVLVGESSSVDVGLPAPATGDVVPPAADLEEMHALQREENVQFNPYEDYVLAGVEHLGAPDEGEEFDEHIPLVYPDVLLFLHLSSLLFIFSGRVVDVLVLNLFKCSVFYRS